MNSAELERLLQKWGRWFGQPPAREWDEPTGGSITAAIAQSARVGLGYTERTKLMPKSARAVEHIAAGLAVPYTARGRQSECPGAPWVPDPEAEAVELRALDLYRYNAMQGIIIRCEYCLRGPRYEVKLPAAREYLMRKDLKMRRYRHELDMAKAWMHGALSTSTTAERRQSAVA